MGPAIEVRVHLGVWSKAPFKAGAHLWAAHTNDSSQSSAGSAGNRCDRIVEDVLHERLTAGGMTLAAATLRCRVRFGSRCRTFTPSYDQESLRVMGRKRFAMGNG